MRFVVRTNRGINTGDVFYKEGEEFPATAVNERWLKLLYEQLKIDLMPEGSGEAHAPDQAGEKPRKVSDDLDALSRDELVTICKKYGLSINGKPEELKARLLRATDAA